MLLLVSIEVEQVNVHYIKFTRSNFEKKNTKKKRALGLMFSGSTCAHLVCEKVVGPKPDQPNRFLQPWTVPT